MVAEGERQAIRRAFSAAAEGYDAEAHIQREIAEHLLSLHATSKMPALILDAGCGTGHGGKLLSTKYPSAPIISLDSAHPMCVVVEHNTVCADIEHLPLADATVDLYWSSLAWQWTNPIHSIREACRTLKPGGSLQVATLGTDTLTELRHAFRKVDNAPHVRDFDNAEHYEVLLSAQGFSLQQVVRRRHLLFSRNIPSLLQSIRGIGAHTLGPTRRKGLLGRSSWQRFCSALEDLRTEDGLPTTYDAIYLIASRN